MADQPWLKYEPTQGKKAPWDKYDTNQDPEKRARPVEDPNEPLSQKVYEAAYPYMRAAENLVPLGASFNHTYIDPLVGMIEGKGRDDVQAEREAYDEYYRQKFPGKLEGTQTGADLVGGTGAIKRVVSAVEPAINQVVTHPESLGTNLQTALSALPIVGAGISKIPGAAAKGLGWLKTKEPERPSLRAYEKDPQAYDAYMERTQNRPRESLVREMMGDLEAKEEGRMSKVRSAEEGMATAQSDKSTAALGETFSKQQIDQQQRNMRFDVKEATALGTQEGDTARKIIKDLKENYNTTAELRNKVLDEANGLQDYRAFKPIFQRAHKSVILADQKQIINDAWQDFARNANADGLVTARQVNEFRKKLQDNVNYGGGQKAPWEIQYNNIARGLNEALDASIPGNQPLRAKIQEETIRYNKAMDLFGKEYPLKQIESAIKDPMMLRDLQNLGVPAIDDIIKTVQYRQKFDNEWARGIKPQVPAQTDYANYTEAKNKALQSYLENKKALEAAEAERFPLKPAGVEPTLNSAIVSNPMHPRVTQHDLLDRYGAEVHRAGPDDFAEQYQKNKVLRDIGTLDVANGSRMTNLGANIGGVFGAPGRALGAGLGASLDYGAGSAYRAATKYGQTPNIFSAVGKATPAISKRIQEKLNGTPYQSLLTGDEKKDNVSIYVMAQQDPEFAALLMNGVNE